MRHDEERGLRVMKLGEIATVRSGLVLARKLSRESTKYQYPLLNLRSIAVDGYIDVNLTDIYNSVELLNQDYLTQSKDIIIRLSAPYTAVLIDDKTIGMVISSNFAVIRSDANSILPEYLVWLMNMPQTKRQIYVNTSSNMLGAINPKFFADFEIKLLPLERQRKIALLNQLAQRETGLLVALAKQKEKYYAIVIDRLQSKTKGDRSV